MARPYPPNPNAEQPVDEHAAEQARRWNRELRHTVRTAKDHAKALPDNGKTADTPRRSSGTPRGIDCRR